MSGLIGHLETRKKTIATAPSEIARRSPHVTNQSTSTTPRLATTHTGLPTDARRLGSARIQPQPPRRAPITSPVTDTSSESRRLLGRPIVRYGIPRALPLSSVEQCAASCAHVAGASRAGARGFG